MHLNQIKLLVIFLFVNFHKIFNLFRGSNIIVSLIHCSVYKREMLLFEYVDAVDFIANSAFFLYAITNSIIIKK